MWAALPRRILIPLILPPLLVSFGTVGYWLLEDLPVRDALYLSVVTLTTVGYGDIVPRTEAGRAFTMFLVLSGVFTVFYAGTSIIGAIVTGEIRDIFGKQQMERTLANMHGHIIVCGYGRMGKLVCREFAQAKVPFVVVDAAPEALRDFAMEGGASLVGDATADEVLKHAGIDRARGLVTVMASDADNLFTTMSARLLSPKLFIVARVEQPHSEPKLLRAGANRVVSPYQIGGARVAHAILRPAVVDFIELATRTEHIELQLEEATLAAASHLVGKTLEASRLRADHRIIIVAIKKAAGKTHFNPESNLLLGQGDTLIALGHRDDLRRLEDLASGKPTAPPP